MPDRDETEILTDEQIEQGPASSSDRPWRIRLAMAQARQDLLVGVQDRWGENAFGDSEFDELIDEPDRLVAAISQATGLTSEAVEDELDAMI